MVNRRAKIVCTLGPATGTAPVLTELVDAGMDVARLNFSHGTRAEHSALYGMVRDIAAGRGRMVGVLADPVLTGAATVETLASNLGALAVDWNEELDRELEALTEPSADYWETRSQLRWN